MIKGINIVGPYDSNLNMTTVEKVKMLGANWISITPESILKRKDLRIVKESLNKEWIHNHEGYTSLIKNLKLSDLKIMLKPHLVLDKYKSKNDKLLNASTWRGDIKLKTKKDWSIIEENYKNFILKYALLAEELNVDLFVIGTELKTFVKSRPAFWKKLIEEVRKIYGGPITYSANWDNYNRIPFWSELNLISINGYFPISSKRHPSVKQTILNWHSIEKKLNKLARGLKKKILISEFGYRNVEKSGVKPWLHVSQTPNARIDDKGQQDLYEAFFKSIWKSDCIIGGIIWNWPQISKTYHNIDFSVKGKPVEKVIRHYYAQ